MQKPNDFPQNHLLYHVIRFLHGEESNFENIKTLIDRSSIDHLVLTFSFLIKWIPNHLIDESTEEEYSDSIQSAIEIISHIIQKVPPIIIYHELPENDIESADCSHWIMSELLDPIKKRIINLRSYILPNNTFHFHCLIPQVFHYKEEKENKKPNDENILRIEKNINTNFETQIFKYLKCLIMNHAPIQFFKPFSSYQHFRFILTNVIIEILDELNQTQNATHEQLLFAFSSIFLYVYAFAFDNDIDGQLLCEYLRSRVFLSPFCLLGMVKYIISYLYLFNLLTPREYVNEGSELIEPQKNNKSYPYLYVDLTDDKTLAPLIQKIPIILINYFLPRTMKKENQINNPNDTQDENNKFFVYMFLSTVEFSVKMKRVFMSAKDKFLNSAHVYSLGVLLLRYIYIYFQRMLIGFVERDMFTPNFTSFIKTVFSILTTTFSDPLATKFYDLAINDIRMIRITLNGTFQFLFPLILRNFKIDNLLKFCIKTTNDNEISRNGRIIIAKLGQCDYPKLSKEVIDRMKETKDIVTLLSCIDFLTNYKKLRNFKESNILEENRQILLNQLIVGNSYSNNNNEIDLNNISEEKPFIFRPFKALSTLTRSFNDFSRSIIEAFESPTQMQAMTDLLSKSNDEDHPWIIYYFSLTPCIENESFCETMTDIIISGLESRDKRPMKANNFILNSSDHYYVASQSLLGRLVSFSYKKAAVRLSQAMVHYLIEDLSALHYITNFISKYRSICPIGVLESFSKAVSNLPHSEDYYEFNLSTTSSLPMSLSNSNHSILYNKIFTIIEILKKKACEIVQNLDTITQEYQSPFQHAMAFAICLLGLTTTLQAASESSNLSNSSVVPEMNDPSLNIISNSMNSFDFADNQGSSFYTPLMEFVSTFDSTSNFDAAPNLSTTFNQSSNFDSNPKASSTPNDIVNPLITDEIAEVLLCPVTDFNRVWPDRDISIKICSILAAQMDNKVAMKYLDLIIKGNNNEFYIQAGVTFLMNANLSVLEYACQSLTNFITDFNTNFSNRGNTNYNAKIDFFFKILIPVVWRIQGESRVGMILMDGILKSITKQTPQKMFNTVIDIITYIYIKLELYEYRIQIIKSAVNSGYSPEMIMLIESCLPIEP